MSDALFDPVPAQRREAVRDTLTAAFGAAAPTALQPIRGGASALLYRVEVAGRAYALRLEAPDGGIRDPKRGFACMRAAAEAGVAPPLRHADPATGVAIMDFIPQRPLAEYPGGGEALAGDLGGLLARLQATTPFPPLGDYSIILQRMLAYIAGSGLFAPGLLGAHLEGFERIRQAYPWDASSLVSSHNDPNPRNILFDGTRLWLIDWETAFRNDPIVDVAIMTNELVVTPALEEALLRGWLGRAPDPSVRARLTLMQPLTNLYYVCLIFSPFAASPPAEPDRDLTALSGDDFRRAVEQGRLRIGTPELMRALGKMQLAGFLARIAAPGFEEAMRIARG